MIRLLNSAMMPAEGIYEMSRLTEDEFVNALRAGMFISYIGYPETAKHIADISGVEVPLNRGATYIDDGDTLLICKLKYRVQNPGDKGKFTPGRDDYEYFIVEYSRKYELGDDVPF